MPASVSSIIIRQQTYALSSIHARQRSQEGLGNVLLVGRRACGRSQVLNFLNVRLSQSKAILESAIRLVFLRRVNIGYRIAPSDTA